MNNSNYNSNTAWEMVIGKLSGLRNYAFDKKEKIQSFMSKQTQSVEQQLQIYIEEIQDFFVEKEFNLFFYNLQEETILFLGDIKLFFSKIKDESILQFVSLTEFLFENAKKINDKLILFQATIQTIQVVYLLKFYIPFKISLEKSISNIFEPLDGTEEKIKKTIKFLDNTYRDISKEIDLRISEPIQKNAQEKWVEWKIFLESSSEFYTIYIEEYVQKFNKLISREPYIQGFIRYKSVIQKEISNLYYNYQKFKKNIQFQQKSYRKKQYFNYFNNKLKLVQPEKKFTVNPESYLFQLFTKGYFLKTKEEDLAMDQIDLILQNKKNENIVQELNINKEYYILCNKLGPIVINTVENFNKLEKEIKDEPLREYTYAYKARKAFPAKDIKNFIDGFSRYDENIKHRPYKQYIQWSQVPEYEYWGDLFFHPRSEEVGPQTKALSELDYSLLEIERDPGSFPMSALFMGYRHPSKEMKKTTEPDAMHLLIESTTNRLLYTWNRPTRYKRREPDEIIPLTYRKVANAVLEDKKIVQKQTRIRTTLKRKGKFLRMKKKRPRRVINDMLVNINTYRKRLRKMRKMGQPIPTYNRIDLPLRRFLKTKELGSSRKNTLFLFEDYEAAKNINFRKLNPDPRKYILSLQQNKWPTTLSSIPKFIPIETEKVDNFGLGIYLTKISLKDLQKILNDRKFKSCNSIITIPSMKREHFSQLKNLSLETIRSLTCDEGLHYYFLGIPVPNHSRNFILSTSKIFDTVWCTFNRIKIRFEKPIYTKNLDQNIPLYLIDLSHSINFPSSEKNSEDYLRSMGIEKRFPKIDYEIYTKLLKNIVAVKTIKNEYKGYIFLETSLGDAKKLWDETKKLPIFQSRNNEQIEELKAKIYPISLDKITYLLNTIEDIEVEPVKLNNFNEKIKLIKNILVIPPNNSIKKKELDFKQQFLRQIFLLKELEEMSNFEKFLKEQRDSIPRIKKSYNMFLANIKEKIVPLYKKLIENFKR